MEFRVNTNFNTYKPDIELPWEFKTKSGGEVVVSNLRSEQLERYGLEKKLAPPGEVALEDYHRCHSQGMITGYESAMGIFYAPKEVNIQFQRDGIEAYLVKLANEPQLANYELRLKTEAYPHPGTELLASIHYQVDAWQGSRCVTLFGVCINVSSNTANPRITVEVTRKPKWI